MDESEMGENYNNGCKCANLVAATSKIKPLVN
jgi:hypothetical protein